MKLNNTEKAFISSRNHKHTIHKEQNYLEYGQVFPKIEVIHKTVQRERNPTAHFIRKSGMLQKIYIYIYTWIYQNGLQRCRG